MRILFIICLALLPFNCPAPIYPSHDWFGTNVQNKGSAAAVRTALEIPSDIVSSNYVRQLSINNSNYSTLLYAQSLTFANQAATNARNHSIAYTIAANNLTNVSIVTYDPNAFILSGADDTNANQTFYTNAFRAAFTNPVNPYAVYDVGPWLSLTNGSGTSVYISYQNGRPKWSWVKPSLNPQGAPIGTLLIASRRLATMQELAGQTNTVGGEYTNSVGLGGSRNMITAIQCGGIGGDFMQCRAQQSGWVGGNSGVIESEGNVKADMVLCGTEGCHIQSDCSWIGGSLYATMIAHRNNAMAGTWKTKLLDTTNSYSGAQELLTFGSFIGGAYESVFSGGQSAMLASRFSTNDNCQRTLTAGADQHITNAFDGTFLGHGIRSVNTSNAFAIGPYLTLFGQTNAGIIGIPGANITFAGNTSTFVGGVSGNGFGWTFLNGAEIVPGTFSGTQIADSTVNSNKFDAPTLALITSAGSSGAIASNNGLGTNTQIKQLRLTTTDGSAYIIGEAFGFSDWRLGALTVSNIVGGDFRVQGISTGTRLSFHGSNGVFSGSVEARMLSITNTDETALPIRIANTTAPDSLMSLRVIDDGRGDVLLDHPDGGTRVRLGTNGILTVSRGDVDGGGIVSANTFLSTAQDFYAFKAIQDNGLIPAFLFSTPEATDNGAGEVRLIQKDSGTSGLYYHELGGDEDVRTGLELNTNGTVTVVSNQGLGSIVAASGSLTSLDLSGTLAIGSYAWASRPSASGNAGKIITISDVGAGGSQWVSTGAEWKPVNGQVMLFVGPLLMASTNGTSEQFMYTNTIPGGLMATNSYVSVSITATNGGIGNNTWKIRVGGNTGTAFRDVSSSSQGMNFGGTIQSQNSAAAQEGITSPDGSAGIDLPKSTINTASDWPIVISVTKATGSNSGTLRRLEVVYRSP